MVSPRCVSLILSLYGSKGVTLQEKQDGTVCVKQTAALRISSVLQCPSSGLWHGYQLACSDVVSLWSGGGAGVADCIRAAVSCWTWLAKAANTCSWVIADRRASAVEVTSSVSCWWPWLFWKPGHWWSWVCWVHDLPDHAVTGSDNTDEQHLGEQEQLVMTFISTLRKTTVNQTRQHTILFSFKQWSSTESLNVQKVWWTKSNW